MKKKLLAVVMTCLMVALAGCGSSAGGSGNGGSAGDSGKVWKIATDTSFKPFEYTDDNGNKYVVNYAGGDGNDIVLSARGNGFSIIIR